ncbi:MAG: hypothetical protein RLZZ164_154 [Actinomycetota bacterium]|jgi:hypothetical protein
MPLTEATELDWRVVTKQLGRPARDIVAIAARCVCGNPLVVQTKPRLADGTPFPTLYYLTHPAATAAISTLEATGLMVELQDRLAVDEAMAAAYLAAHQQYIAQRAQVAADAALAPVDEIDGISAGGMPTRVKCLHALVGHSLAAGPGVNPVGDIALELSSWQPSKCQCDPSWRE